VNPYADAPRLPEGDAVDLRSIVRGDRVEIEIGPGRGGFMQERALACPDVGLVGLEVRRKWAAIFDGRLAARGLGARARVFAEDAKDALPRISPAGSVAAVYFHFPDPWWKKRHAKRLVIERRVIDEVARLLAPGGDLFVQTDVAERLSQYTDIIEADPRFTPAGDLPGSPALAENPYGARSPRERRAIADGLPVHRVRYKRTLA
jgi:tRNA (guanine-N7-)-methyltransferase